MGAEKLPEYAKLTRAISQPLYLLTVPIFSVLEILQLVNY